MTNIHIFWPVLYRENVYTLVASSLHSTTSSLPTYITILGYITIFIVTKHCYGHKVWGCD